MKKGYRILMEKTYGGRYHVGYTAGTLGSVRYIQSVYKGEIKFTCDYLYARAYRHDTALNYALLIESYIKSGYIQLER